MNIKDLDYKKVGILLTYVVLLIAVIFNLKPIFNFLSSALTVLSPLIIGIVIAFLFNILMIKYEKLFFKKDIKNNKPIKGFKRVLSLTLTLLTVFLCLFLIMLVLVPQLYDSIKLLIDNIGNYTVELKEFGQNIINKNNVFESLYSQFMESWMDISKSIGSWVVDVSPSILNGTISVFGSIFNFVLGLVFAIYLLFSKERILSNVKKTLYAFVPVSKANKVCEVSALTIKTFTNFVGGQLTEAIILGVLCTLGMLILGMPYAVLIGVVVGVTSVIPIFGAYLGAIPSAFLLFMEDPLLAVLFLVFLVILQQFESNVIYPKVVGKSVGLTGLWILLAVVIGAAVGGIFGVLIGVPLCSVLYYILRDEVNKRIKKRKINVN